MEDGDKLIVQVDAVKPGVTTEVKPTVVTDPKPETKPVVDPVKQQIEALSKQISELKEQSKREIQSMKDKALEQIRKSKMAEDALKNVRARVQGVSPELAKEVELEELRARAKGQETLDSEEEVQRQQEEFHKNFRANIEESLIEMGLDVKNPTIDWGEDAPNYIEAQKRILKSAAKLKKEQEVASKADQQKQVEKLVKEAEAKIRKELGLDSVDTSQSGAGSSDEISFVEKVASGAPLTKEERIRASKMFR